MKIIASVTTSPSVQNQQQQPIGYLGWELPLLAGFALGIAMASVRGKEQSEVKLSSQTKERVPIPVELTRTKPPIPEQKELAEVGSEHPKLLNREHYLSVGDCILDKLGTLTQSTILISTPGAGKTTTICTAWGRMKKRLGSNFYATVIVYKTKDKAAFKGIADEVICFPEDSDNAVLTILNFVDEMKKGLTGANTRRLFVDDFLTTWSEIEALYKGKYLTHDNDFTFNKKLGKAPVTDWLISQLNAVFLIGRESDDALWISSHSPNVEDLPFVASKGARISANLLFLARQDPNNSNGNYEVIQQNINNAHLVSSEQKRKELAATLPGLIELSQQSGEPIILTSHGNSGGWELGLIGKHIRKEYEDYRQQWSMLSDSFDIKQLNPTVTDIPLSAPTQNPIIDRVKQLRNEDKSYTEIMKLVWGQSDKPEQELIETYLKLCLGNSIDPLTRNARTIYNYISERGSCSYDAFKKWCNRNDMPDEVRSPAIQELLTLGFIVDADNGYSRTENAF